MDDAILGFLSNDKQELLKYYPFIDKYLNGRMTRGLYLKNIGEFEAELLSKGILPYEIELLKELKKIKGFFIQRKNYREFVKECESLSKYLYTPPEPYYISFYYRWKFKELGGYTIFYISSNVFKNVKDASEFPLCYELLHDYWSKSNEQKAKTSEVLNTCCFLLARGYINIIFNYPNIIKHYRIVYFKGDYITKMGYLLTGWGGELLEFNLEWIENLFKAIKQDNKRDILKIIDHFGHSIVHERAHFDDEGLNTKITSEGLARFIEFIVGHYLFSPFKKELEEVLDILLNKKDLKDLSGWEYSIGLYLYLIIFIELLSRRTEFQRIPQIQNFSGYMLKERIDILINFKKIAKRAGILKEIVALAEAFRMEMQKKNYPEVYALFRRAETNLNMQRRIPPDYIPN